MIATLLVGWIICGILNYGLTVGHYQTKFKLIAEYHVVGDRIFGVFTGLFGPIGLIAFFIGRVISSREMLNPPLKWML